MKVLFLLLSFSLLGDYENEDVSDSPYIKDSLKAQKKEDAVKEKNKDAVRRSLKDPVETSKDLKTETPEKEDEGSLPAGTHSEYAEFCKRNGWGYSQIEARCIKTPQDTKKPKKD